MVNWIKRSKNRITIKTFGNSMFPLLHDGDILTIAKIKFEKISLNDIICIRLGGRYATHRVIYKTDKYLVTKGDNNLISDGKVFRKNVYGRVEFIKRNDVTFSINDLYLYQSSIYFGEIRKVIKLFGREKIDFVILKGLPLHLMLEGKHPRRLYADCDILISKKDIKKAVRLLVKNGYKTVEMSLSMAHEKFKDKIVEVSYGKIVAGFLVVFDIHFEAAFLMTQVGRINELYPQKLIDDFSKALLKEKRMVKIDRLLFPMLSVENQIIYLFLHLFHHNFRGVYRYDILLKILILQYNCAKLRMTINRYKLSNFIYPALFLLNRYYPESKKLFRENIILSKISAKYIERYVRNINIFDDENRVRSGVERFLMLFLLSPEPFLKRFTIVKNEQVIYSILWVLNSKIVNSTSHFYRNLRSFFRSNL